MRRILHFIDTGGLYGAESVILNLSAEMRRDGRYEPVVGCIVSDPDEPCDLYDEAQARGIEAVKLRVRNALLPLDLPRAAGRMKELGIDLIHSHGYKPSVYGYVARKKAGCPIMATCHLWFKGSGAPLKMKAMVALELRLYRNFPAIVAVSEPIRDVLAGAGVDPSVISVVENGVDVEVGNMESAPAPGDEKPAGRFRVLNVGRLSEQKAQKDIVRAAKLVADGIDCEFLIVGGGPLADELQGLIDETGVGDRVRLLGFRREVAALLDSADAFALPSVDEGMPMSLLEAAVHEVPIIATPVGDIPKLIVDGETGLSIPMHAPEALAGAVVDLARRPDRGRSLALEAKRRVTEIYSNQAMYGRYREIYADLLD